jgi:hypothetical protein
MMQGICGQCLHIDEKNTQTFCCKNQDLNLENISFNSVENRSNNNGLLEKVTKIWLSHMQA